MFMSSQVDLCREPFSSKCKAGDDFAMRSRLAQQPVPVGQYSQGYAAGPCAGYPGLGAGNYGASQAGRSVTPGRHVQQLGMAPVPTAPRLSPAGWSSPAPPGPQPHSARRGSFGTTTPIQGVSVFPSGSSLGSNPNNMGGTSVTFVPPAGGSIGFGGSAGSLVFSQQQGTPRQPDNDKTGAHVHFNNGGHNQHVPSSGRTQTRTASPAPGTRSRAARRSTIRRASDLGELKSLYEKFDRDRSGSISLLEFAHTLKQDSKMANIIVPGLEIHQVMYNYETFDAVSAAFNEISGGKARISFAHFTEHFRQGVPKSPYADAELRVMFDSIDAGGQGVVSKLQLLSSVQHNPEVSDFVLPGMSNRGALEDAQVFDAVSSLFDAIAGGKKRFDFTDFAIYFSKVKLTPPSLLKVNRTQRRILIIGPGFGRELNPRQSAMIIQAGYQVRWCSNLPNPEQPGFNMMQFLPQIKAAIDEFQPELVAAASKGGAYLTALWQTSCWVGPSLILNAHPTARRLPEKTRIVLASGSNDEVYVGRSRTELEQLISTGSRNHCFLYYTANSGQLPSGHFGRMGDMHNMESLVMYACLPRLIDAPLADESPEMHMVRSWLDRLSDERIDAEAWLGHSLDEIRRFWASAGRRGKDQRKLFPVQFGSQEFQAVESMFKAAPKELPAYCPDNYEAWENRDL